METSNACIENEVTICIKHLLIMVMKKWKSLLVLALIGGLLGLGLHFIPKDDTTRSKEDTELIRRMEVAAQERAIYERERTHISNSYLMQVNASDLYIGSVQYYVYDCEDADYVMAGFNVTMQDESLRGQLCQVLGITDEKDLDYFAGVGAYKITETSVSGSGEVPIEICEKLNLYVSVNADTKERAEQALMVLQDAVAQKKEQLQAISKCTVEMMSKSLSAGSSSSIQSAQSSVLKTFSDAYNECVALETGFSDEEYELYEEYFVDGDPLELPIELFPSSPIKLPVILAMVALFIGCVWYVCVYLFSGRIMTADDLQDFFGIQTLAFIAQKETAKLALDRWLNRLELSEYPASVTADYTAAMLADGEGVAVLYCKTDAASEAIVQEMVSRNANIVCMNFVGEDLNSLTNLKSGDRVVLLLRLNNTKKVQVQHEVQVCVHKGVQIMGAILTR